MMSPLWYLRALYTFLTQPIESKFPSVRRAISHRHTLYLIVAIIGVGAAMVVILVTYPSVTTSSTYP